MCFNTGTDGVTVAGRPAPKETVAPPPGLPAPPGLDTALNMLATNNIQDVCFALKAAELTKAAAVQESAALTSHLQTLIQQRLMEVKIAQQPIKKAEPIVLDVQVPRTIFQRNAKPSAAVKISDAYMPGCSSVGSIGHPVSCGDACKYHTKGGRCKDGRFCVRCHECKWSKHGAGVSDTSSASDVRSVSTVPSVGSIGHPKTCGEACKYVRRKGGCRDGDNCTKCHVCHWSRTDIQEKQIDSLTAPLPIGLVTK